MDAVIKIFIFIYSFDKYIHLIGPFSFKIYSLSSEKYYFLRKIKEMLNVSTSIRVFIGNNRVIQLWDCGRCKKKKTIRVVIVKGLGIARSVHKLINMIPLNQILYGVYKAPSKHSLSVKINSSKRIKFKINIHIIINNALLLTHVKFGFIFLTYIAMSFPNQQQQKCIKSKPKMGENFQNSLLFMTTYFNKNILILFYHFIISSL